MTDRPVEPPLSDELPEMIQRASEVDDPTVYRLCDVILRHRKRMADHEPRPAA